VKFTIFATVPILIDDLIDSLADFFKTLAPTEESDDLRLRVFPTFSGLLNISGVRHVHSDLNRVLSVEPIFNIYE
jgi:hypothetical protein